MFRFGALAGLAALLMATPAPAQDVPSLLGQPEPVPTVVPVPETTVAPLPPLAEPVRRPKLPEGKTVRGAIKRAGLAGKLGRRETEDLLRLERRARAAAGRLEGARRAALAAVLARLDALAAEGWLHSSRIRLAGKTLRRNLQVLTTRRMPKSGERLTFPRDPAVFQYWPGRGLYHHPLASAGRANARASICLAERRHLDRRVARQSERRAQAVAAVAAAKRLGISVKRRRFKRLPHEVGTKASATGNGPRCRPAALRSSLDSLLELGAERRGSLAWEYLVVYGGGRLPWVSAMAQATAAQALARGGVALADDRYENASVRALGLFDAAAPSGVRGYLMYSFDPSLRIVNGHMQSVIGLHDVAELTGSRLARRLYRAGERSARAEVLAADTGAWTLYSRGGREAPLHYHRLVRVFARRLCDRTEGRTWCAAEKRFARYLREAPRIRLDVARRVRAKRPVRIAFSLSKVSRVEVRTSNGMHRHMSLPRGRHSLSWTPPRRGTYTVRVVARGPEGRRSSAVARVIARPVRAPRDR